MKTTKFLLSLLLIPFSLSICYAQTDSVSVEKKTCDGYMQATYIFEGKTISSKYITIKTGEHTLANFMAYLIEVDKVIKGNIQKGTIEILQGADGIIDDEGTSVLSSDKENGPPGKGLYFCWDKASNMTVSTFTNSNTKTLSFFGGVPIYDGKIHKDPFGGISLYFSTLSDFYAYIGANYGIKIDGQ